MGTTSGDRVSLELDAVELEAPAEKGVEVAEELIDVALTCKEERSQT